MGIDKDVFDDRVRGFDIEIHNAVKTLSRQQDEVKETETRVSRLRTEREQFIADWQGNIGG